jgi:DNA repair protein RecO (recombination protein O)
MTTVAAATLADAGRLAALRSACSLASMMLPPHDPHPNCYAALRLLLDALGSRTDWLPAYARWEMGLLAEIGFGLDLTRCAAGGDDRDLAFVSPRSGRAVSRAAGQPYRDRLLPLPAFLIDTAAAATADDVRQALGLTGFFLERHAGGDDGRQPLPLARRAFAQRFSAVDGGGRR